MSGPAVPLRAPRRRRPRTVQAQPLLERRAELDSIEQALQDVVSERGRLLLIEGSAGVGKTRLLLECGDRGRNLQMGVHGARASEIESEFPFGIALQLFEPTVATSEHDDLFDGAAGLAKVLFDPAASQSEERAAYSLIHGLYWLLCNLAYPPRAEEEERPQLLLVDDAQWADQSSLGFLLYVAQRLEELPVGIVLTLRSGESTLAEDLIANLRAHPSATVIRPQPLSRKGTTAFVRRLTRAGDEFCDACWKTTGGNPFLLQELMLELRAEGVAPSDQNADRVRQLVPASVLRSLLSRISRVGPGATQLAAAVAVLGGDAVLADAASLASIDTGRAQQLADALVQAGVLASERLISFVHPLVRSAIYHDLGPHLRDELHLRAAAVLRDNGATVERVAAHLLATRSTTEEWTRGALREAARAALARGAPAAAADFLTKALEGAPAPSPRADVLRELASAQRRAGIPAATHTLAEALDLLTEPERRAETLGSLGKLLFAQARFAEAAGAFDRGLAEVAESDPALARELEVGYVAAATLDPELRRDGLARLQRYLAAAEGDLPGDPALLAQLALRVATTAGSAGEVRRLALAALADQSLARAAAAEGLAFGLAVSSLVFVDGLEEAERAANQAADWARNCGSVLGLAAASTWRAWTRYYSGDLLGGMADAEQTMDARRFGWNLYLGVSATLLAHAHLDRGDQAAAETALAAVTPQPPEEPLIQVARARLCLLRRDPRQALALATAAGRAFDEFGVTNPGILPWRGWAARAAAQLGEVVQARRLVQEERELAEGVGAPRLVGLALHSAALVERGERQVAGLEEALEALERSPAALERTRIAIDLGAALRRAGATVRARQLLREGREAAHRMAALGLAGQAEEELRAAGARPRRIALGGPESLTASELRVAELAAAGMSNREIAQALFVTIKNVEQHLRNAYRKLDITSRAELASAGIAPRPQPSA